MVAAIREECVRRYIEEREDRPNVTSRPIRNPAKPVAEVARLSKRQGRHFVAKEPPRRGDDEKSGFPVQSVSASLRLGGAIRNCGGAAYGVRGRALKRYPPKI